MSKPIDIDSFSGEVLRIPADEFLGGIQALTTPVTVVQFGAFTTRRTATHQVEAFARIREVGMRLAHIFGGSFVPEHSEHAIGFGTPEHVDGVVPHYWQLNVAWLQEKKNREEFTDRVSTELTLRKRVLPEGRVVPEVFPPLPEHGLRQQYMNSIPIFPKESNMQDRTSVAGRLYPLALAKTEEVTCLVPLGDVAIFANGMGSGQSFWTHQTRTILRQLEGAQLPTSIYGRNISMGRVVVQQA
jgi:hypothetical protein